MPGERHHRAAGDLVGKTVGGSTGCELVGAQHSAFVGAMALAMRVAAGVALISAVAVIVALPRRRHSAVAQAVAIVGAMVTLAQRLCPGVDRSLWCLWRRLRAPSLSKPLSAGLCPTMADRYPTNKRSTDD
jgi:hypothetical protein